MQDETLIGIDLGKHSFHPHGQDRRGGTVRRKEVTRKQPIEIFASFYACIEAMESCAGEYYTASSWLGWNTGQPHLAAIRAPR